MSGRTATARDSVVCSLHLDDQFMMKLKCPETDLSDSSKPQTMNTGCFAPTRRELSGDFHHMLCPDSWMELPRATKYSSNGATGDVVVAYGLLQECKILTCCLEAQRSRETQDSTQCADR